MVVSVGSQNTTEGSISRWRRQRVMLVVILGAGRRVSGDRRVIGLYALRGAGGSGAASSARHRGGAERAGGAGRPVGQAARCCAAGVLSMYCVATNAVFAYDVGDGEAAPVPSPVVA